LELWIAGDSSRLLANDTILGHPAVTVTAASLPSHGTLLMAADGSFSYRPDAGFVGTDRFTYSFSGGGLTSNVATVTIHVTGTGGTPINHPPVLSGVPAGTQTVSLGNSITFQATGTDPDTTDTLTFSLRGSVPSGAAIDPQTGAFAWTPLATQLGPSTFTVRVTDNGSPNLLDEELISIFVNDTTPPVLSLPGNLTLDATGPSGVTVTFTASATDLVDGGRPVTCSPSSGSIFPVGPTTVNCSAKDLSGNTANGSFTVTVKGPATQITSLISTVNSLPLSGSLKNSLTVKLQKALDGVNAGNLSKACGGLKDFISATNAQTGKSLTAAQATALISDAKRIGAVLGCT
jgi:hypothetical protein